MKLRPTIFLSGVSSEFASFRNAVEVEIQKKGCFAENQSSFGVDYHTVEEMLRRRISDSDAVIHIVGFRFGAEPKDRPADKPRRSYTQMEYDIARELEKPVYVFLSSNATIADAVATDDAEAAALQLAHRQTIKSTNNLRYTFKDKDELRHLAAEIDAVAQADFRVEISRIDRYAPTELIGREDELALLNDAWLKVRRAEPKRPHILTFVALGGEGKTSLVAKWLADLAFQNWPGCDSAFAWSFYSQGTREQYTASDLFLKEAITFFGNNDDKEFAASAAGAYEKGQRLARIVGKRRSLLILDGVEPLQYLPTSLTRSELKDDGIISLLKGLAADSEGLCIVTTRYSIPNLKAFSQTTAPEVELLRLSREAGVHLLKTLGVHGTAHECETLVEDVKGHALTLNLLGTYLRDAYAGDIRRRGLVKLEEADAEEQSGHAFGVIAAYEATFEGEGDKGKRALAILRLLGHFDRPITADCLSALLEEPAIAGLTDSLVCLNDVQRNLTFKRLEDAKLLTVNREPSGTLISLDAHPLLREYFAKMMREQQPNAWRAAHQRLYEHLCATTPDKSQPTLEELQPLYQAIVHGCEAGLQDKACNEVYFARINRQQEFYSTRKLGAFASDLGAVACFFENPWRLVSLQHSEAMQAWLLAVAAFNLRALGRLTEALEPMRAGLHNYMKAEKWHHAAIVSVNLSALELALGNVAEALRDAEESVIQTERGGDSFDEVARLAGHAAILHAAGQLSVAETRFREAEEMQKKYAPEYPLLYSHRGFLYCDLLLTVPERAAWKRTLECGDLSLLLVKNLFQSKLKDEQKSRLAKSRYLEALSSILQRAGLTLKLAEEGHLSLLTLALEYLTLGRITLYEAVFSNIESPRLNSTVNNAVNGLRRAGTMHYLPNGLLTRAWLRFLTGQRVDSQSAQEDLNEAWEIAERGPMRLHMADIHLYRARLFFREKEYPWESPEADLKAARKLIEQCGYWRRKEELEDAERVILKKST